MKNTETTPIPTKERFSKDQVGRFNEFLNGKRNSLTLHGQIHTLYNGRLYAADMPFLDDLRQEEFALYAYDALECQPATQTLENHGTHLNCFAHPTNTPDIFFLQSYNRREGFLGSGLIRLSPEQQKYFLRGEKADLYHVYTNKFKDQEFPNIFHH